MSSCTMLERLPRELRDIIYEEALTNGEVVVDAATNRGAYIPGLLRTCKQIRAEATKLFYAGNHFRIITPQNVMFTSADWLQSIASRNRKQLRRVTVHFEITRYHPGWSFAHMQELHKSELQSMMMTDSRYFMDKRRVETFDLLEQLATFQHVRRKTVAFEVDDIPAFGTTTHGWVHDLGNRLLDLRDVFADRGLVVNCRWCTYLEEKMARLRQPVSCV
ncbi:hypothetical protein CERZMDRAFT_101203 [Cercospora zeae-maydis SCOH1-5]|uniref:Uncharacterized protein n=1 Tax=Cercospora zeae-maydis SCOH1-5 TaxID=717836 RepID=A0A6A6F6A0_9PEZI|nr:hypothetical protein CERZMDRAFT_101203 [Cercospora zeae-maydis SCOH1-5]